MRLLSLHARGIGLAFALCVALAAGALRAAAATPPPAHAASTCPWVGSALPIGERVAMVMRRMSLRDEITLVEGHGVTNSHIYYVPGIPHLCLPEINMENGPSGVGDLLAGVTQLPAGVSLAATWDPPLAERYGAVIGAEERAKGVNVVLGPTINIDRDPRWGRLFESFSEDPRLTAEIATAEIRGIQGKGVIAEVKHFAVYNQETFRNTPADDAIVGARALHEIYLPAFRAAIRRGEAGAVMCAYSTVNGEPSCQNSYLLTQVLRGRWDFAGFVTSDYQAVHATAAALDGTDQEQPFSAYFGASLLDAVQKNVIPRAALNTMVARILTELFRFGLVDHPLTGLLSALVTSRADARVARQVAEEGTVLLKNDDAVLPLAPSGTGTIAVIGPGALVSPGDAGGGSAYVAPTHPVSPLGGIEQAVNVGRPVVYAEGLPADADLAPIPESALSVPYRGTAPGGHYSATLTAPETGTYVLAFRNPCHCYAPATLRLDGHEVLSDPGTPPTATFSAAVKLTAGHAYGLTLTGATSELSWARPSDIAPYIAKAVHAAKQAAVAIVVVSDDTETEAADRPDLRLPSAQNELVDAVAAANPRTVVVIDAGAPIAMPWLDKVAAVLDAWYPGQANGTALAAILFGAADPGGHLPVTFPRTLASVPAAAPARFPGLDGKILYGEGLDVGYRWYDATATTPLFPFGFGLSYTKFAFSDLRVQPSEITGTEPVRVTARVSNVGKVAGSTVVQLYLGMPPAAGEPPRQLIGFERVELAPGASRDVTFMIRPRTTWWWHDHGWTQTAGTYRVYVGDSSALGDLELQGAFRMTRVLGERRVVVTAPRAMQPGVPGAVHVTLTPGGDETLDRVRLDLTAPSGWSVAPLGQSTQTTLAPGASVSASFRVVPPTWTFAEDVALHAEAKIGSGACSAPDTMCLGVHRDGAAIVRVQP